MLRNNKNFVILFLALFLVLLGIQAYLLYKTYQVKEREIYRAVISKLSDYTDKLEDGGSIKKNSNDSIMNVLVRYKNNEITKRQFEDYFRDRKRETSPALSAYVNREFLKEGYHVAVKFEYLSIISLPEKNNFIDRPVTIYETDNKVTNAGVLNTGTWQTSSSSSDSENEKAEEMDSFHIRSKTSFQILNIKYIVFKELILLLLLCVIILGAVLSLFILTVKNLFRQQKQVQVLHTVVDNISHEFKTPIATLKIAAKTLNKDWSKEHLPLVERQIARLERLMKQLNNEESAAATSRVKSGDWHYFIEDLQFLYPDKVFDFTNNSAENLPFDKAEMETIIKNIAENSIKYGASKVNVSVISHRNQTEIIISDDGKGIAKEEQNNVFEKFYRIQSDNIHDTRGLGLGLFLVKNIVAKYQGEIALVSSLQRGATFKIILPNED